ncbi:MAG: DUF1934 domain-containing protein [Ruminococcaceae bacterium]|nr:DUF1934 domain-containing protein [Oscillospiraceae bacterium]
MEHNATITVRAEARREDGECERIAYTVPGAFEQTAAGWAVVYAEPEESGMAGTQTRLDVASGRAELTRAGAVSSRMVFSPGSAFTSLYETPYGRLRASVRAASLRARVGAGGALLRIEYELELGGARSRHDLAVRVRLWEEDEER